jgi:hypothetical protein
MSRALCIPQTGGLESFFLKHCSGTAIPNTQVPLISERLCAGQKRGSVWIDGKRNSVRCQIDLDRREEEHQAKWPKGHIKQVGRRTTEESARKWEEEHGYS